ncbi:LysR family transcriptional regulator [Xenophilus arseniciresistens]|uniref:LysR family transcriptional regulator n=1 Tax=Xenophilus arseniciresistens TaxID=1283306 RepID=A0AAE3SXW1_9BURK|nr:LysR family transcriptional regulator [Xenophilus arseniciresistens]MDA7414905.1 LysR family transcriptional regulator [Xenophilus arseniciresistens]
MLNSNWDNLRVFLAVARHNSAVEASASLSLDHSTVTRRLKILERELGTQLFGRNSQGHVLTHAGRQLLRSVEAIENSLSMVESQVGHDNKTLIGKIRLGATEGFGSFFLTPHLCDFCERHPQIRVDVLSMPRCINLSKREADLAISVDRPTAGFYVASKLSDYRLRLYATPNYLASHPPIKSVADISHHRLIAYVDELSYSDELRYVEKLAPGALVRLRSTSIIAQLNAARRGKALAILPCFLATPCADLLPVLPDEASLVRTFWLIAHKEQREIARIRVLWDYLRQTVEINRDFLMGDSQELRFLDD